MGFEALNVLTVMGEQLSDVHWLRARASACAGLLLLMAFVHPAVARESGTPEAEVRDVMMQLSTALKAVQQAATGGDLAQVQANADGMVKLLDQLEPPGDVVVSEGIAWPHYASAFVEQAQILARVSRVEDLSPGIRNVRRACINCHARFRPQADVRRFYPATKNTVLGRVRLRSIDHRRKNDASSVVVFVDGMRDVAPKLPIERPVIRQKDMTFTPPILPIVVGTTVSFPNDDTIFHNIFSLSPAQVFDLGIYPAGETRTVTFNKPGLVRIYCNIHPSMVGNVLVLSNDLFATTDVTGTYVISEVPDGKYALRLWHEFGDEQLITLNLQGGQIVRHDFDVTENRRFVQHRNKFNKRYPKKY